jgi:NAD(P)-dependent dehydrogenase (short-subunit alcohol dehydrogenase family)
MTEGPSKDIFFENKERPLAGKVALITGVSRNIGASIAQQLAIEGTHVIGLYRDPTHTNRANIVKNELIKQRIKSEFILGDITDPDNREKIRKTVDDSFDGKLDYLILNASGEGRDINVIANNAMVDLFLPKLNRNGIILLMQSVQGHFETQLSNLRVMPEFYSKVAPVKNEGEKSLRSRAKEFKEKGVSFIVACPPLVSDTGNVRAYERLDPLIYEKNRRMSQILGTPIETTKKLVAEKIAELLKRKDLPMGYVELFGNTVDARAILSAWYGPKAIFVDTFEKIDEKSGIGRLIVTREHTEGHLNEEVGILLFPAHLMMESSAQTLGLVALGEKTADGNMPLFKEVQGSMKFLKDTSPGDILQIHATITEMTKRELLGNAKMINQRKEVVAEINGMLADIVKIAVYKRLKGIK